MLGSGNGGFPAVPPLFEGHLWTFLVSLGHVSSGKFALIKSSLARFTLEVCYLRQLKICIGS